MSEPRCPGQDQRYWKPDDIFEVPCPLCGVEIEFWKDEAVRTCPGCKAQMKNPRIDLGCAKWCLYAKECLKRLMIQSPDNPCGPVSPSS